MPKFKLLDNLAQKILFLKFIKFLIMVKFFKRVRK